VGEQSALMPHMNLSHGLLHLPPSSVSEKKGGSQMHWPGSTHFSLGRQSLSLLHWAWLAEQTPEYASPVVPIGQTQLKEPTLFSQRAPNPQGLVVERHLLMS
jgi:hypothetical protein